MPVVHQSAAALAAWQRHLAEPVTGYVDAVWRTRIARKLTTGALVLLVCAGCDDAVALKQAPMADGQVALAQLPLQARQTYQAIVEGGPFRFDKDGAVFGNRERLLPPQRRGHYREYTVATPGAGDRGARRIVCAGTRRPPDTCWYTADHYASFRQIAP